MRKAQPVSPGKMRSRITAVDELDVCLRQVVRPQGIVERRLAAVVIDLQWIS